MVTTKKTAIVCEQKETEKGRKLGPHLSHLLTWFVIQMLLITSKKNLILRNLKKSTLVQGKGERHSPEAKKL